MTERAKGSLSMVAKSAMARGDRLIFSTPTIHPHLGLPNVIVAGSSVAAHIGVCEKAAVIGDIVNVAPMFQGVVDVTVTLDSTNPALHPGTMIRTASGGKFTTATDVGRIKAGIMVTPGLNVAPPSSGTLLVECQMVTLQWST